MSRMNNSVETVNAAATAIITAESRVQQVTLPRRRWGACFSVYWCFGSQRQGKRISHAVLVPEPAATSGAIAAAAPSENPNHPPAVASPFIAPPSSPASFLQSESASAAQSPAGFLSLSGLSPSGPASIFTVGPYANETQLVTPPVFSTFTTEPSTAPYTPPPEPVQLTTPSSPEVPFAKLLTSFSREAYEFQSYQLYPGSPIGHLISPSSACSGTSSPFPVDEPPRILTGEALAARKLVPRAPRKTATISPAADSDSQTRNEEPVVGHRVSFELTAEEVARCMEKKPGFSVDESPWERPAGKEFKFSNPDGSDAGEPGVAPDWWAGEKVVGAEAGHNKNWAFFHVMQPGVS